jgi:hypothetical protein
MSEWKPQVKDALHYWEARRLPYNLLLAQVGLGWLALTWPHFRSAVNPMWVPPGEQHTVLLLLTALALSANICYTAVYLVDFPLQVSFDRWKNRRWVLWLAGTILAILLENYWIADEIYPFVNR